MQRTPLVFLTAALALAAGTPRAAAQQSRRTESVVTAQVSVTAGFTTSERRVVTEYFAEHRFHPKPLPPGIAKNLARGKPLPPGIAKQQVPASLRAQLPPRDGIEISIVGDRIVLLEASGLVVDILEGIFR
jgi:hypothetical protein